jgi:hypothetical protein
MGRAYLKAEKQYKIVKVAPDGLHYWDGGKEIKAVFYPRSPYLKKFDLALRKIHAFEEIGVKARNFLRYKPELVIPHFQELKRFACLPSVMMDEGIFYPDADAEVTSVDGWLGASPATGQTWANLRSNTADREASDSGGGNNHWGVRACSHAVSGYHRMARGAFLFDISSLASAISIDSATLSQYVRNVLSTGGNLNNCIYNFTPAANTSLIATDYSQCGITAQTGTIATNSLNAGAYNAFTLNAAGIAHLEAQKASVAKFCGRSTNDAGNSDPGFATNKTASYDFNTADEGTNKPKLTVIYTPAPSGGGNPMFFSSGGVTVG